MLTERQYAFLVDEARLSGLSMGELIRRAVDRTYRKHARPRIRGMQVSLGMFRDPDAAAVGRPVGLPD